MAEEFGIVWSRSAVRDLDEILEYLADQASVDVALGFYEEIRRRIADLSTLPRRCRQVPELQEVGLTEFRELIRPPHRIFFRLIDRQVILLGILDSRRDLEEILIQRALEA